MVKNSNEIRKLEESRKCRMSFFSSLYLIILTRKQISFSRLFVKIRYVERKKKKKEKRKKEKLQS